MQEKICRDFQTAAKQVPAAGLASSAKGLFPVLLLQVPAEVPAEEAQPPAVDGASPERSMPNYF
jgi:hypothetical protein